MQAEQLGNCNHIFPNSIYRLCGSVRQCLGSGISLELGTAVSIHRPECQTQLREPFSSVRPVLQRKDTPQQTDSTLNRR